MKTLEDLMVRKVVHWDRSGLQFLIHSREKFTEDDCKLLAEFVLPPEALVSGPHRLQHMWLTDGTWAVSFFYC